MEALLASVVIPAVLDMFKSGVGALSRRFLGLSIDDQIKLENAAVGKIEALAKLDNPYGTPSQWVVDLRASFRYVAAVVLILGGLSLAGYAAYASEREWIGLGLELAGVPFGFIFGERMWAGMSGKMK